MKPLLVLAFVASAAWGQGTASLRARELFYTPPPGSGPAAAAPKPQATAAAAPTPAPKTIAKKTSPKPTTSPIPVETPTQAVSTKPAPAGPLGMRYSVLKRNAAGQYAEVDVDSTFHSGDRIRLEVQANTIGYLYVVAQGSSGNWQLLFPAREVAGGSNQVHRGETRLVPGGNAGQFVFDEQAGTEKLFFVLSRQPEANLEKLIYSVGGQGAPAKGEPPRVLMAQVTVGDDVISRIRGEMSARDLIFEKVENEKVISTAAPPASPSDVKIETAAYVVNPSTAPDARLVVDLKLKHQ